MFTLGDFSKEEWKCGKVNNQFYKKQKQKTTTVVENRIYRTYQLETLDKN
jgi:hypothetical protein